MMKAKAKATSLAPLLQAESEGWTWHPYLRRVLDAQVSNMQLLLQADDLCIHTQAASGLCQLRVGM
jgi:hypothetical protein